MTKEWGFQSSTSTQPPKSFCHYFSPIFHLQWFWITVVFKRIFRRGQKQIPSLVCTPRGLSFLQGRLLAEIWKWFFALLDTNQQKMSWTRWFPMWTKKDLGCLTSTNSSKFFSEKWCASRMVQKYQLFVHPTMFNYGRTPLSWPPPMWLRWP